MDKRTEELIKGYLAKSGEKFATAKKLEVFSAIDREEAEIALKESEVFTEAMKKYLKGLGLSF